jgi:heptose I phosphotransferase
MVALHEAIPMAAQRLPAPQFSQWKRGLTIALAQLVLRLHGLQRFHKDLYLCHFFIDERITRSVPPTWNGQLVMIDLQRLDYHPWTAAWWKLKDLAQLVYSTNVAGITPRDRLRFARHYAGETRRTWRWRWLSWLIGIRWRNYERHNIGQNLPAAA